MRGILAAAATVGLVAGIAVLRPDLLPLDAGWARGVGAGALVGTSGSIGGFWLLLRNLRGGHGRFLAAVFGGMLARMALFAVVLVLVVQGGVLPVTAFLAGLIPGYLGFQAAEMWYLHCTPEAARPPGGVERRT